MKQFKATIAPLTKYYMRPDMNLATIMEQEREHLGKDFLKNVFSTMWDYRDLGEYIRAEIECNGELIASLTIYRYFDLMGKIKWCLETRDEDSMRSCLSHIGMEASC